MKAWNNCDTGAHEWSVIWSSATGSPSVETFAAMPRPPFVHSIATSSIQCGRCQRSIACSRAACVVVATR
jgi:hypothetical protein